MNFNYRDLDDRTRTLMKEEIDLAARTGQIYYSKRFNSTGTENWVTWLTEAAESHDEHWLAFRIWACGGMKGFEERTTPSGGYTVTHVPDTASQTLADGQFNRFYIAALCRRALDDSTRTLTIYRAKQCAEARPESEFLEGTSIDANSLLMQLRNKQTSFTCALTKPNSGLSVHL